MLLVLRLLLFHQHFLLFALVLLHPSLLQQIPLVPLHCQLQVLLLLLPIQLADFLPLAFVLLALLFILVLALLFLPQEAVLYQLQDSNRVE
ncbi:hypothetical protein [Terribacillus halophilus]|uniref:hypothetical protein n=1 Tax=Terribacillus halophilus TaxID=361279 RepID=UPI000B8837F2|nr:hypothetical protein [Terribacillus halophilus]